MNTAVYKFGIRLALAILLFTANAMMGQNPVVISGLVRDSLTHEPVAYAAVALKEASRGTLTDSNGQFRITTAKSFTAVEVSAMGFTTKIIPLAKGKNANITVDLQSTGLALNEVVVRPKKQKYSKKNNPAVDFVNRIRNAQYLTDPRRNDYYSFDKYERITIALNNIAPDDNKNLILKRFDCLKEHIDTSEVSGRPILNISAREKSSKVYYRKSPKSEKEQIHGVRQVGLDDFLDEENMRILYEDFFTDIDLYNNDVYLLHNQFVSPLSRIAPDFYKFYLTDTVMIDSVRCIELSFVPHNAQTFGFTGKVYVPEGDTTMFIKKVVMNVPKDINLNFIERIYINQEFERASDGSRLLVRDDLVAEINVLPGMQGLYFRRNTAYNNHSFSATNDEDIYGILGKSYMVNNADARDEKFWIENRLIPLSPRESEIESLAPKLRKDKLYYWGEKFLKIMVTGYIKTGSQSKFDIGPMNTLVSSNWLEGARIRLGGMTTANLNPHLFARGYAAYGLKDNEWKYSGVLEYSFPAKKYHPREFPTHSLRLTHTYDVDMLGQHYAFTNADNMFLSLKRQTDYQITYHRITMLDYTLELPNNFSLVATLKHERQIATAVMPFVTSAGNDYSHYNEASVSLQLRYAPGEKFYQTKTHRITINSDAPVFMLTHTYAPKGFMGSMFEVNKTEMSIQKRFWFSAFGYIDGIIKGGHLWSKSAYPDLLIPNANLSYTIQPESFAMMNPMEFMNDSYVSWDLTYWANGTIFNYIPYFNKLKLREVFSFRGLYGHLSDKNNPAYSSDVFQFPQVSNNILMKGTPYMEAGVGIDNIFKVLRLDYVWRLTYRNYPGVDKSGLRLSLHFTF